VRKERILVFTSSALGLTPFALFVKPVDARIRRGGWNYS